MKLKLVMDRNLTIFFLNPPSPINPGLQPLQIVRIQIRDDTSNPITGARDNREKDTDKIPQLHKRKRK